MIIINNFDAKRISGGDYKSVDMVFNLPLSAIPIVAESFPKIYEKSFLDLATFVKNVKSNGIDPTQVEFEIKLHLSH